MNPFAACVVQRQLISNMSVQAVVEYCDATNASTQLDAHGGIAGGREAILSARRTEAKESKTEYGHRIGQEGIL